MTRFILIEYTTVVSDTGFFYRPLSGVINPRIFLFSGHTNAAVSYRGLVAVLSTLWQKNLKILKFMFIYDFLVGICLIMNYNILPLNFP